MFFKICSDAIVDKFIKKTIKKFDKNLTSAKLMQSDLMDDKGDQDYKDKVAKCFEMRSHKMKSKQNGQSNVWEEALNSEKNYIMYKKGYKHMLDDIEYAKKNLNKFKRGLSIFED